MTAAPIVLLLALSARTVTLDEAERAAEAQKPEVRVAQANAAAGVARTEQARAPLLPQIKVEGEYDRTTGNRRQRPGRTTPVANSWTFYNWFEGQVTGDPADLGLRPTLNGWRAAADARGRAQPTPSAPPAWKRSARCAPPTSARAPPRR